VCVIIAAIIPFVYKPKAENKSNIDYKTFHSGPGWGYDIVMNGKLIIHQEYIPAIAQKKEFATEKQAIKTAELVVARLRNNKLPTVSKTEVEKICQDNN
jgi:hypothetical protein